MSEFKPVDTLFFKVTDDKKVYYVKSGFVRKYKSGPLSLSGSVQEFRIVIREIDGHLYLFVDKMEPLLIRHGYVFDTIEEAKRLIIDKYNNLHLYWQEEPDAEHFKKYNLVKLEEDEPEEVCMKKPTEEPVIEQYHYSVVTVQPKIVFCKDCIYFEQRAVLTDSDIDRNRKGYGFCVLNPPICDMTNTYIQPMVHKESKCGQGKEKGE